MTLIFSSIIFQFNLEEQPKLNWAIRKELIKTKVIQMKKNLCSRGDRSNNLGVDLRILGFKKTI